MGQVYNIYCDESCHLENDRQRKMVLGAITCPLEKTRQIAEDIRAIKSRCGLSKHLEIKWTKVSPGKLSFYETLLRYFFDNQNLTFRCAVMDKSVLHHEQYGQTHDDWYYKMYFNLLKVILEPRSQYRIYLDIKDTLGGRKIQKLRDVLCNNMLDFTRSIIGEIQLVQSHEIEQMQLADLLIGIMSYVNRNITTSPAKRSLVELTQQLSGYSLTKTTLLKEQKFNIFIWEPGRSYNGEVT